MGNAIIEKRGLLPSGGLDHPSSAGNDQTQWSKAAPLIAKITQLKEYWTPFDKKHGQKLQVAGVEKNEIIFVRGEYQNNSYSVLFPDFSTTTPLNAVVRHYDAIMRYYIDQKFMEALYNGREKTLLFVNNEKPQDQFRLAGFLVTGNKYHVVIADKNPTNAALPDSFHAVLFPLEIGFNEKKEWVMETTVYAARGQSVVLNKDGKILEKDHSHIDPGDRTPVLKNYFSAPVARPYFYYEAFVNMAPWPN